MMTVHALWILIFSAGMMEVSLDNFHGDFPKRWQLCLFNENGRMYVDCYIAVPAERGMYSILSITQGAYPLLIASGLSKSGVIFATEGASKPLIWL